MGMSTGTSTNCGSVSASLADNCRSSDTGSGTNKWGCNNSSSCVKLNDGTPKQLCRTASHWICRPSRASLRFFTSTYREIALTTLSRVSSSRVMRMSFCNDGPSFTRSLSKARRRAKIETLTKQDAFAPGLKALDSTKPSTRLSRGDGRT